MSLLEKFNKSISQQNLFTQKDNLLLAVSGGLDSVVLCELCKQAGYDFMIAHCNFQLRGEESERDEKFVRQFSEKYGVDVLVKKFDTEKYATANKISVQEAARNLRYEWFNSVLSGNDSLKYILTAHHADDNIETVLMNFSRGTGLHGLTGIPVKNTFIRRPLLLFSKDELIRFASDYKLGFVEDSSNQSDKYTRNFFRNEIIPAISKVYPQVKENLLDNINRFKSIEKLYQLGVTEFKKKLCRVKGNEVHIPVLQLLKFNNRALVYEIISPFGFTEKQVDELFKMEKSESGKYLQSPANDYRILKHRHWFIISPVDPVEAENIIIEEGITNLELRIGELSLESGPNSKSQISNSPNTACLDLKEIQFPLLLRKWKQGDYFYPLGMKKKKKLSRFFIDQKLSKSEKEKTWVIESAQRIIWVVGHRIDERFKVTDQTENMLKLCLSSS